MMPAGPKGEKRPADVVGAAAKVMKIATGEIEEEYENGGNDPAAKTLGAKGGKARARALAPERRSTISPKAAEYRWRKL